MLISRAMAGKASRSETRHDRSKVGPFQGKEQQESLFIIQTTRDRICLLDSAVPGVDRGNIPGYILYIDT